MEYEPQTYLRHIIYQYLLSARTLADCDWDSNVYRWGFVAMCYQSALGPCVTCHLVYVHIVTYLLRISWIYMFWTEYLYRVLEFWKFRKLKRYFSCFLFSKLVHLSISICDVKLQVILIISLLVTAIGTGIVKCNFQNVKNWILASDSL